MFELKLREKNGGIHPSLKSLQMYISGKTQFSCYLEVDFRMSFVVRKYILSNFFKMQSEEVRYKKK